MSVAFNIIQHTASKFLASQYWRPIFEVVKLSWNWNSIIQINVWEFKNSIKIGIHSQIKKQYILFAKPTKKSLWNSENILYFIIHSFIFLVSFLMLFLNSQIIYLDNWISMWTPFDDLKNRPPVLWGQKFGVFEHILQPRMGESADSTNYLISGPALLLHFFTPLFLF